MREVSDNQWEDCGRHTRAQIDMHFIQNWHHTSLTPVHATVLNDMADAGCWKQKILNNVLCRLYPAYQKWVVMPFILKSGDQIC